MSLERLEDRREKKRIESTKPIKYCNFQFLVKDSIGLKFVLCTKHLPTLILPMASNVDAPLIPVEASAKIPFKVHQKKICCGKWYSGLCHLDLCHRIQ